MGKAKRKLMEARKACYEQEKVEEPKEEPVDPEYEKNQLMLYRSETALILRKRLIEFSERGGYPLCEYLDFTNTENYVTWLLDRA